MRRFTNALVWAVDGAPWLGKRAARPRATDVGRADYVSVIPVRAVGASVLQAAPVASACVAAARARARGVRGVDVRDGQTNFLGAEEDGSLGHVVGPRVQFAPLRLAGRACAFSNASQVFEHEHGAGRLLGVLDDAFGCDARLVKDEPSLFRFAVPENALGASSAFRLQALPESSLAASTVSHAASRDDEWSSSWGSCYGEVLDAAVDANGHDGGLKRGVREFDADVEVVVGAALHEGRAARRTNEEPTDVFAAGFAVERDAAAVAGHTEQEFFVFEAPFAFVEELEERRSEANDASDVAVALERGVGAGDVACCGLRDLREQAEAFAECAVVVRVERVERRLAATGVYLSSEVVARVGEGLHRLVEQLDGADELEAGGALHKLLVVVEDDGDLAAEPGTGHLDAATVSVELDLAFEGFGTGKGELQRRSDTMYRLKDYGSWLTMQTTMQVMA